MDPNNPSAPSTPAPTAPAAAPTASAETEPNPEKVKAARELVEGILGRMGVTAQLTVNDKADGIHIGIKASRGGEALGGGRRAGVVESLAYLVNKAINREEQGRKWVFLEVGSEATGGGESPDVSTQMQGPVDPAAQAIAEEMVAKCKKMGGVLWIGPLASGQRNQLQYALSKIAGVRVKAEGEGHHRRLVIEAS